jgi:hypothetical protein
MITLDGDGQHDPDQIPLLANAITTHLVDVAIGSRFLDNSTRPPNFRKRGIKVITSASNYGTNFKLTDSQSGFRAYSQKAINLIHHTETGMSASTEILQKISNKGLSVAEVPITITYNGNTSKHNSVSHGISVLINTLKFVSVKHPLPFYGMPGIIILILGIVFSLQFIEIYFSTQTILYGSLLAGVIGFLFGSILIVTSIILFSMNVLIREKD